MTDTIRRYRAGLAEAERHQDVTGIAHHQRLLRTALRLQNR